MILKVVIVEDEELLREGLLTCVPWEEMEFEVIGEACNGNEGLEVIEKTSPDIVITDIKMPYMDGLKMSEYIHEKYPEIELIIISGYDEFEYARRAIKAGVTEYILKPVRMEQLKEVLLKVKNLCLEKKTKRIRLDQLETTNQYAKESLRKSIYASLLHRADEEVYQRAIALLGEEILDFYYGVGICEFVNFAMLTIDCDYLELLQFDSAFEEFIEKHLLDEKVEVIKAENGERLLCFWGEAGDLVREKMQQFKEHLVHHMRLEHLDFFNGQPSKGLGGLKQSFMSAKKIKEREHLRQWDYVEKKEYGRKSKIKYMNYDTGDLFFEIKCGNPVSIRAELRKFEEEMNKEKIVSNIHVILLMSNLYHSLMKLPVEYGVETESILGDPMKSYHEIISKPTRKQMLEELEKVCIRINTYLESVQGSRRKGVVKRIENYIHQEYANEKISMKDVAEHSYISTSYLSFILKEETGKTFVEYLTEIRMQQAKFFLEETQMKTFEIAQACGYSNPTYFSTVFKNIFGVSPTTYRKKIK